MDHTEEFRILLADPNLVHYAICMNSEEDIGAGIFEDFEAEDFPNNTMEGDCYSIAGLKYGGHYWMVASIPLRSAPYMEKLAKKNGLMTKDSKCAPWELQVPNLFVLEKNPGYVDIACPRIQ